MSATMRWTLALVVFLLGVTAAAVTVFGGAFSTVACVQVPPDSVYYVLIVVGTLILVSATAAAVLVVRKARVIRVAIPAVVGMLLTCGGLGGYFVLLGQYC